VDYKDVPMLRKYMSDRGKIRSRRVTGNCAQHQRALAQAIKTARELVLLPYTQRTVTERPGGRRDRGERGERSLSEATGNEAPRRSEVEVLEAADITVDLDDGQELELIEVEPDEVVDEIEVESDDDEDGAE
jgi:small subunit ribosomal protein S18